MVAFFLEVGLLLIVLPWSGFWERTNTISRNAPQNSPSWMSSAPRSAAQKRISSSRRA